MPRARRKTNHPADVDRLDWLRAELQDSISDLEKMRADGSWQAVVNQRRQVWQIRDAIDALREERVAADGDGVCSDAQLLADVMAMPRRIFRAPELLAHIERCKK